MFSNNTLDPYEICTYEYRDCLFDRTLSLKDTEIKLFRCEKDLFSCIEKELKSSPIERLNKIKKAIFEIQNGKNFLDKKPDINVRNYAGQTPLYAAITYSHTEAALLLLDAKADFTLDYDGYSALTLAVEKGNAVIVDKLLSLGVEPHCLMRDELYDDPGNTDCNSTVLHAAVRECSVNIVESLCKAGAKVNFYLDQVTALDLAVELFLGDSQDREEDLNSIAILLKYGASIKNFVKLFDGLMLWDQRDSRVLFCLTFLCEQESLKNNATNFKDHQNYFRKLKNLRDYISKEKQPVIGLDEYIPPNLIKMVEEYSAPSLYDLSFFSPAKIDTTIAKVLGEQENKNTLVNRGCSLTSCVIL